MFAALSVIPSIERSNWGGGRVGRIWRQAQHFTHCPSRMAVHLVAVTEDFLSQQIASEAPSFHMGTVFLYTHDSPALKTSIPALTPGPGMCTASFKHNSQPPPLSMVLKCLFFPAKGKAT